MARHTDPVCRLCRREGMKLYLEGRALLLAEVRVREAQLCAGHARQEGLLQAQGVGLGLQLREKQKARRIYGVQERQFRRYFRSALRVKGMTGVTLLVTLERRLDNVVYRMGLADSRAQARQLVRHGHFMLNGHNHDVPSYLVEVGDVIEVRPPAAAMATSRAVADRLGERSMPDWLEFDDSRMAGRMVGMPDRQRSICR